MVAPRIKDEDPWDRFQRIANEAEAEMPQASKVDVGFVLLASIFVGSSALLVATMVLLHLPPFNS